MPRILNVTTPTADIGSLMLIPHSQALPFGTLLCDGSTLLISQYPKLFAKLGTLFGGDGTTNFQLPDYRGRAIMGAGLGAGLSTTRVHGQSLGAETAVAGVVPTHGHSVGVTGVGNHQHYYEYSEYSGGFNAATDQNAAAYYRVGLTTTGADGSHSHSITTQGDGSSAPHDNMQPSLPSRIVMAVI